MKKQELVCDYCGKVKKGGEHHLNLPKGWYVLVYHCQRYLIDDWRVTHHFCSSKCLNNAVQVSSRKEATKP